MSVLRNTKNCISGFNLSSCLSNGKQQGGFSCVESYANLCSALKTRFYISKAVLGFGFNLFYFCFRTSDSKHMTHSLTEMSPVQSIIHQERYLLNMFSEPVKYSTVYVSGSFCYFSHLIHPFNMNLCAKVQLGCL